MSSSCRGALGQVTQNLLLASSEALSSARGMTLPRFDGHFSYAKAYTGGIMTKRVKRRFTPEFRTEVVKLVIDGWKTSGQVARDHDLGTGLVAH